ncbi:MAG: hypothetical protein H0W44_03045 [Gammaproteobacteria bacterium]|nr:hypothetical protein [Gammaproteobacteria bacterium]
MTSYYEDWQALVGNKEDVSEQVREHLMFLVSGSEDEELLDNLMEQFVEADIIDEKLVLRFEYADNKGEMADIKCEAPFEGDDDAAPASWVALAQAHNGIHWEARGGGWFTFNGLNEDGGCKEWGWDFNVLEEASDDNESFIESLEEAGYSLPDLLGVIDYGQNWIIGNPAELNAMDEPTLHFVSHDECIAAYIDSADDLTLPQFFLRLLCETILNEKHIEEIYS